MKQRSGRLLFRAVLCVLMGIGFAVAFVSGQPVDPGNRLVDLLRRTAEPHFPGCRVDVEIVRVAGELPADLSREHVEIRPLMKLNPGMVTSFEVRGRGPRGSALRAVVSARLRVFRNSVVACRNIPAGSIIGAADVTIEQREIGRNLGQPLNSLQQAIGKVARGTIRKGEVLTDRMLRDQEVVRRGDPVRIVVVRGPVQVEASGLALQSGMPGEEILVRNRTSGRTLRAVVAGPGEVEIRL